ncbi:hypothetical protein BGW80DRAFT_1466320 [Lactifluus volemus]|nr:hypothetical protein BGW80DRAFT_1466320 [Lactifluus volemus]
MHCFSDLCDVENSIARHGETLVELKLFLCPMVTSTEATLRPRMFQTMGSGLDRLRSELSPQAQPFLLQVASGSEYSEELVAEQLARNYAFLIASRHAGARSGVARLRLIDFDYVTLSSSIVATAALLDAACYCTICAGRSTRRVVRGGADGVEMTQSAPCSSSTVELLEGADWVVVELLADCVQNNIKAMGPGTKSDPTRPAYKSPTYPCRVPTSSRRPSRSERSSPPTPTMTSSAPSATSFARKYSIRWYTHPSYPATT